MSGHQDCRGFFQSVVKQSESILLFSCVILLLIPSVFAGVMSETIYDGFEKMAKKQNKEQVPPVAEPQQKKPNTGKQTKKSPVSGSSSPTHYKTLEEAVKAVSEL